MIDEADKNGWAMTTISRSKIFNIYTAHVFTLLGIERMNYEGKEVKLVKIRNPYGDGYEVYKGPWHDGDERWTDDLRKQIGAVNKNDGVFYMEHEDFNKPFNDYTICYYDNWKTRKFEHKGTEHDWNWSVKSDSDQVMFFNMDYIGNMYYPNSDICSDYVK